MGKPGGELKFKNTHPGNGIRSYCDLHRAVRQQLFNQFRPFNETISARVEVLFITHIENLFDPSDPVKIKMIGIEDKFTIVGNYDELINYYGLTEEKIAFSIVIFLENS